MKRRFFENGVTRGGKSLKARKVSFQERYRNSEGEWKLTHCLGINDIPKAILVLSKAYEYLVIGDSLVESGNSGKNGCMA
jgi:hypothetical protein